jgi:hypothetical protein
MRSGERLSGEDGLVGRLVIELGLADSKVVVDCARRSLAVPGSLADLLLEAGIITARDQMRLQTVAETMEAPENGWAISDLADAAPPPEPEPEPEPEPTPQRRASDPGNKGRARRKFVPSYKRRASDVVEEEDDDTSTPTSCARSWVSNSSRSRRMKSGRESSTKSWIPWSRAAPISRSWS